MHKETKPEVKATSHYDKLAEKGIFWLNEGVRDEIMGELGAKILLFSLDHPDKDIFIFINSPGGSITSGLMFYDILRGIPNTIVTVAVGMAASMGQFLLTVGTPGHRYITKSARVLLHQPLGGIGGTVTEAKIELDLITSMKDQLGGITADRTSKSLDEIHKDGNRDNWFSAEKAVEYGFADHIVENFHEVLATAL